MNLDDVIAELRERNEPVPQPLRLPTPQEVDRVPRQPGVTFHPDCRKYLLEASDVVYGYLEPATVTPGSKHTELIGIARDAWEMGAPRDMIPLCEDHGDCFCMNKAGKVVYWSHDGQTDESWPDLATWLEQVWLAEE